jgi:hypothetical protein
MSGFTIPRWGRLPTLTTAAVCHPGAAVNSISQEPCQPVIAVSPSCCWSRDSCSLCSIPLLLPSSSPLSAATQSTPQLRAQFKGVGSGDRMFTMVAMLLSSCTVSLFAGSSGADTSRLVRRTRGQHVSPGPGAGVQQEPLRQSEAMCEQNSSHPSSAQPTMQQQQQQLTQCGIAQSISRHASASTG